MSVLLALELAQEVDPIEVEGSYDSDQQLWVDKSGAISLTRMVTGSIVTSDLPTSTYTNTYTGGTNTSVGTQTNTGVTGLWPFWDTENDIDTSRDSDSDPDSDQDSD